MGGQLEMAGLQRRFGTVTALDDLSFSVTSGRVVGFLGPNGAGKTTALNAILGLTPYQGELRVLGRNPWNERDLLMRELGRDFDGVIREKGLTNAWNATVETFRTAAELHPLIVWNGYPDGLILPNHLAAQGFYLLRARTQLREISSILLK